MVRESLKRVTKRVTKGSAPLKSMKGKVQNLLMVVLRYGTRWMSGSRSKRRFRSGRWHVPMRLNKKWPIDAGLKRKPSICHRK